MASAPDLVALPRGVEVLPPWSTMQARDTLLRAGQMPRDDARVAVGEGSGTLVDDGNWRRLTAEAPAVTGRPRWQVRDALREAAVTVGERECETFAFGRWRCGPDNWNYVGDVHAGGRQGAEPCLWAHPSAEGPLRVAWTAVTPGRFSGRAGFTDTARVQDGQAPVNFRIFWNGETVTERAFVSERGLRRIAGSLGGPGDRPGELVVEVQADDVGMRHFCFDLSVRPHRNRVTRSDDGAPRQPDERDRAADEGSGASAAVPSSQGGGQRQPTGTESEPPEERGSDAQQPTHAESP